MQRGSQGADDVAAAAAAKLILGTALARDDDDPEDESRGGVSLDLLDLELHVPALLLLPSMAAERGRDRFFLSSPVAAVTLTAILWPLSIDDDAAPIDAPSVYDDTTGGVRAVPAT